MGAMGRGGKTGLFAAVAVGFAAAGAVVTVIGRQ